MTTGSRKTRNYTGKKPMLAFGQVVLPIAALVAIGLLFVGIKLFFLTPPARMGVPVTVNTDNRNETPAVISQPADDDEPGSQEVPVSPPMNDNTSDSGGQNTVLARPVEPTGSTGSKPATNTAKPVSEPAAPKPVSKPADPAAKKPAAQGASTASGSGWVVQIGAFTQEEGAKTLSREASKAGYSNTISAANSSSGTKFYRVRVAAGATREDAQKLAAELEKKGYPVLIQQAK